MATHTSKFWKPGSEPPGSTLSEERVSSEGQGSSVVYNPYRNLSLEQQRLKLPVFQHRTNILYLVESYQTVIVVGETGSGKSTQIPQYLLEAGWAAEGYMIAVTQPRRVAAVTVATRVSEERGRMLGQEVGYTIRFDDVSDPEATRVKFMTDGMLVREMMQDPLLSKYSVVMLDEVHERTIHTDIILGLLKKIQKKRKDLRLIVASATMDAEEFKDFFNTNETGDSRNDTAAVLSVEGRMFPVDVHYSLDPVPNYVKATVETAIKIHHNEKPGDILAFLTGMEEVEQVVSLLIEEARKIPRDSQKMMVLPMHGSLPASEQMKVFQRTPNNVRKIVVATNIAEASITISGIVYVIDSGFVKLPAFNPKTGIESLVIVPVSQASAEQRAGRAGRVRSGKAYRLYTEEAFHTLAPSTVPEIQRAGMASVVLQLKALGIDNVVRFNFLSPPPAQNMVRGVELLYALGALDDNGRLTNPLGYRMAEFPLHPLYAKMLLISGEMDCSEEAVIIAAMMQIQNVFITPPKQKIQATNAKRRFSALEGDHLTMLNVYLAFVQHNKRPKWCHENFLNYKGLCRASDIKDQMTRLLKKFKIPLVSCEGDAEKLRRCLTAGFFANAAKLHYSGEYRTVRDDHPLSVHPTSVLYTETRPQWVIFNEIVQTNKDYMRDLTAIQPEWLYELAPHYYQYGTDRELAAKRARLGDR
ncbi:probable ATP-dependent RNA helicase DHX35 [Lingula anatina]|uniref:RNA helicase n=1 Tax=Lingula anatina TaxID=7574 RepID=A0A1S3K3V0_LINAN|nr:probable ATP-dependent RNA helicase DHX35 [Lingula anatina]|eukprot:XP_013417202.1 probable ATP-dependent RNA helicase DHX35 [Lingula anatina]